MLISPIEIYDHIWLAKHIPQSGKHSVEPRNLAKKFIDKLEVIPDMCTEIFMLKVIEQLKMYEKI